MGMLTDFIQGAAKSASGILDNKLKEITDQEMLKQKNQLEIEREKRIEEAQMRMHEKVRGEQLDDYGRTRADKVADTTEQRTYESQKDDKNFGQSVALANLQSDNANRNAESAFNRNKSWATNSNNPDVIKSQVETKLKQMEFEQKSQVDALYKQYQSETDPAKKETIADSIDALTGKRAERLQKVEVQVGMDGNTPIFQDVLYDTKRQKVVDIQGQYDDSHPKPMSTADIEVQATRNVTERLGAEPLFWDTGDKWETEFEKEKARLQNLQNGSGMIGRARQQQSDSSNNIGNIRSTTGAGFNKYDSVEDGVKAIDHQLELYGNGKSKATGGKKLDTLADVISTYSPPNENDTARLISDASKLLGISPDQKIDLENPVVRKALTQAIIIQENGKKALTPDVMKAIESIGKPNDNRDPLGLRG